LVALQAALELPAGSALALFALGRSIGWIGHALEQYATGELIRPRARYVGERVTAAGRSTDPHTPRSGAPPA
jgi:citrate synthase